MQQLTRQGTQQKQLISQLEEDLLARWAARQVCRQGHTGKWLTVQGWPVLRRAARQKGGGRLLSLDRESSVRAAGCIWHEVAGRYLRHACQGVAPTA